jgi:hypothetical protein
MHTEDTMMSLYDYLRRAAGSELGKQVAKAAKIQKVEIGKKLVSTKGYSGEIQMYPKSFLDRYFGNTPTTGTEILYSEPDNLPI